MARERKENRTVLFPVCVDKAVFESPLNGQQRSAMSAISVISLVGSNTMSIKKPSIDCFAISRKPPQKTNN
jgi:hypothetical protein